MPERLQVTAGRHEAILTESRHCDLDLAKILKNFYSHDRDFPNAIFGPSGILGDGIVSSLASVGPILSLIQLEKVVGEMSCWRN